MSKQTPPREIPPLLQRVLRGLVYCFAAVVASMGSICVNSLFAGYAAIGALQAFALGGILLAAAAFGVAPRSERHPFFARLLLFVSAMALLSLVLLLGKRNQMESAGLAAARVAVVPVLMVLLAQLGLAVAYWARTRRAVPRTRLTFWSWGPATLFVPLLLASGFVLHISGARDPSPTAAKPEEPAAEVYTRFFKPEDYPFARETQRAGADFGGNFVHTHTGVRPLLGLAFSTRTWHRELRLAEDLRGIFDREAPHEGEQVLLARPGYVVAGLQAQVDENVRAVRIRFAADHPAGPNLADAYWSEWAGGADRSLEVVELGGTGDRVLGITGSAGLVVNSLGLLIDSEAPAVSLESRTIAR